jgi:hypothetical protein
MIQHKLVSNDSTHALRGICARHHPPAVITARDPFAALDKAKEHGRYGEEVCRILTGPTEEQDRREAPRAG